MQTDLGHLVWSRRLGPFPVISSSGPDRLPKFPIGYLSPFKAPAISKRISVLYAEGFGIIREEILQVATRNCIEETYFDVQKTVFGKRSTFF